MTHLVRCQSCGVDIPSSRWRCTSCGRLQPHGNRMIAGIVIAAMLCGGITIGVLSIVIAHRNEALRRASDPTYRAEIAKRERQRMIERQFSAVDGRHFALVDLVRKHLHDPASFEHIETSYEDHGNHVRIAMIFRAKSILGTKVINVAVGEAPIDGSRVKLVYLGQPPLPVEPR